MSELFCENVRPERGSADCGWELVNEPVRQRGAVSNPLTPNIPMQAPPGGTCLNGHAMEDGDQLCLECGAEPGPAAEAPPRADPTGADGGAPTTIDGWTVERRIGSSPGKPWDRFNVRRLGSGHAALMTLYQPGFEPDPAVHEVLRRMPKDHVPELFATGRFNDRAYDVVEQVSGGSLERIGAEANPDRLRSLIDELGRALASFAEAGLRHRDLRPKNILVREPQAFDLVVTGFGSARLSDFDLEAVAPLSLTRYSAPEAIVGAVSAASDWWSLGMIALEQATGGRCFEGVNDRAFLLHVVARGVAVPAGLDERTRLLLRGLLARDAALRWGWPEVRAWLVGEHVDAPEEAGAGAGDGSGPALNLGGRAFRRPELFALAASEAGNWAEGCELTVRGALATWLDERGFDSSAVAEVRRIAADSDLAEEYRHSLAMMALNRDLPFAVAGEIVTPAWLLANSEQGYAIVTGAVCRNLARMAREPWLVRLRTRAEAVRERARLLEVDLDESSTRVALLASSRANLEAKREQLRFLFPDTDHIGLASILERSRLSDEDLVILIGAAITQFTPLAALVEAALDAAARASVQLDRDVLPDLLARPRRDIFALVGERVANFARCGIATVDDWADSFRVERRMPLPRAAVLLAVPGASWREPPKQQYVASLLEHLEKRVSGAVGRGPLVRFVIGKTTPRVDLAELGTLHRTAEAIVNHVVSRTDAPIPLDPAAWALDEGLEGRIRRLDNHATMFRRDTGIDGRYLGFPFLVARDARSKAGPTKPRFAPALLWPVAFALEAGSGAGRGATLAFDREREEVRVNPALEGLLGAAGFAKWQAARDDLLARQGLRVPDVVDILAHLAEPRGRVLTRLPGKDVKLAAGAMELVPAAALFNAEFTGQSVAEDLRLMRGKPLAATALEAALRAGVQAEPAPPPAVPERDRYLTVESDPSQDAAVLQSRLAPGLLVEGPPGTGKSQTIVNIVGDALGHGQTVLVVCQKQAALKVVRKRLDAEGLGDRLFVVTDVNRDREAIVRALRDQVAAVRAADPAKVVALRRQREDRAARIEALEGDIDRRHWALHAVDDASGLSYRGLIGELVGIEAAGSFIDAPRLRPLLGAVHPGQLPAVEEACGPLARLWLASRYESSPLSALRSFSVDVAVERTLCEDLTTYAEAEAAREALPASDGFETEEPDALRTWLAGGGSVMAHLPDAARAGLASWLDLFRPGAGSAAVGGHLIASLAALSAALERVDASRHDQALFERLASLPDTDLREQHADLRASRDDPGFFGRLLPARWFQVKRANACAAAMGGDGSEAFADRLLQAMELEAEVRPLRRNLAQAQDAVRVAVSGQQIEVERLRRETAGLLSTLRAAEAGAAAVFECPAAEQAEAAARSAAPGAYDGLRSKLERACTRHDARARSRAAVLPLATWFQDAWIADCETRIARGMPASQRAGALLEAMDTVAAYQRFRTRAAGLPQEAVSAFAALRLSEASLRDVPPAGLDGVVRRTIRREALLAAKGKIEAASPELLYEQGEIESKITALENLDGEMRGLNRQVLKLGIDGGRLGPQTAWDDLTRLRGPRMRRLREILDRGGELGLMQLRPIWLMNPDVASRVLPLKAGLFDLVIYDEASQMPVEHAVPTLFRAGRVVVSGDEKQMPPSSFFSGGVEPDEDDVADDEDLDDGATEAERTSHEESWNKREVKDCPDLLQLARYALPSATLQIHYRSNYRELIGFSNAAFYGGALSIPARHPEDEFRRARPVEVVRVDGVYAAQTNEAEAARVVDVLARIWSASGTCPSVGVVTFNRKQADLVEDAVERRAAEDPEFGAALRRERDRVQGGEDMGFFVKNVENVQGDERDVIVFSTTFGRDARGTFRRSFGVLGQTGGERRLNVAVTRARDKVVLVTSMPVADVSDWLATGRPPSKPRDYLQAYLDYATKASAGDLLALRGTVARLGPATAQPENSEDNGDGFTASVGAFLAQLGYDPVPAGEAGDAFGMDFAVVDPGTGLFGIGVECDTPKHPLLKRARAREIWRRGVLSRAIPAMHRVSSHDWYHSPAEERARLRAAVQAAVG